jgi:hypothetical protein
MQWAALFVRSVLAQCFPQRACHAQLKREVQP